MKRKYEELEIELYAFETDDVVTLSTQGEANGDETQYPIPGGWGGAN